MTFTGREEGPFLISSEVGAASAPEWTAPASLSDPLANTSVPVFEKKPKPVVHHRTCQKNLILLDFCGGIRVFFCLFVFFFSSN